MDAMATHLSSDANPASVPLSRQRTLALDGMWYSRDEFLDCYGAVQGMPLWEEIRKDKARCGILAYDGIVYPQEEFLNYYKLDIVIGTDPRKDTFANDVACGSGSATKPVQHDVIAETTSVEEPLSGPARTLAVASTSANDIASGSGSATKPVQHDLIAEKRRAEDPLSVPATRLAVASLSWSPSPVLFNIEDLKKQSPWSWW